MLKVKGWKITTKDQTSDKTSEGYKVSLEPLLRPRVNCSLPITLFVESISVSFIKGTMYNLGWLVDY